MLTYRRAVEADFQKIALLEKKYFIKSIAEKDPTQLANGFFATFYPASMIAEMNQDLYVAICMDQDRLCGYLSVHTLHWIPPLLIPQAIIQHLPNIFYEGKSLAGYRCFMVSQICIDHAYHGLHIYRGLCCQVLSHLKESYDLAVAFIPARNQKSLAVVKHFGFTIIDQLLIEKNIFYIIVLPLFAGNCHFSDQY